MLIRKYGTHIMNDEECLLFMQTAIENDTPIDVALEDMRMLDNILAVKQQHLLVHGTINKTSTGRVRRGTSLYDAIESVVNARAANIKM